MAKKQQRFMLGIDESGTGAIAGPFHIVGVVLPYHLEIEGVTDSKKLSDKRRRELVPDIEQACVTYLVGTVMPEEIAKKGQGRAWQDEIIEILVMLLEDLKEDHGIVYGKVDVMIDGLEHYRLRMRIQNEVQHGIRVIFEPKADANHQAVGAASILAKSHRNCFMNVIHKEYPEYGWDTNAGYGTEEHAAALVQYGRTEYHRPLTKKWDLRDRVAR